MPKVSDPAPAVNKPKVSIRRSRVVQIGSTKGRDLQRCLAFKASALGLPIAELHRCITVMMIKTVQNGPPPGGFSDAVVMAIHQAPYQFRDL